MDPAAGDEPGGVAADATEENRRDGRGEFAIGRLDDQLTSRATRDAREMLHSWGIFPRLSDKSWECLIPLSSVYLEVCGNGDCCNCRKSTTGRNSSQSLTPNCNPCDDLCLAALLPASVRDSA